MVLFIWHGLFWTCFYWNLENCKSIHGLLMVSIINNTMNNPNRYASIKKTADLFELLKRIELQSESIIFPYRSQWRVKVILPLYRGPMAGSYLTHTASDEWALEYMQSLTSICLDPWKERRRDGSMTVKGMDAWSLLALSGLCKPWISNFGGWQVPSVLILQFNNSPLGLIFNKLHLKRWNVFI